MNEQRKKYLQELLVAALQEAKDEENSKEPPSKLDIKK